MESQLLEKWSVSCFCLDHKTRRCDFSSRRMKERGAREKTMALEKRNSYNCFNSSSNRSKNHKNHKKNNKNKKNKKSSKRKKNGNEKRVLLG